MIAISLSKVLLDIMPLSRPKEASNHLSRYPQGGHCQNDDCETCINLCPTTAISKEESRLRIHYDRCIFCGWCVDFCSAQTFTWAIGDPPLYQQGAHKKVFSPLLYLLPFDAGDCGFCLDDIEAVVDFSKSRIEIVREAEEADVLLVVGAVPTHRRDALAEAYNTLKEPKIVIACGACALSGGIFANGMQGLPFKADIMIPGCPPSREFIFRTLIALMAINHE